jgi:hypothetical protein
MSEIRQSLMALVGLAMAGILIALQRFMKRP